MRVIYCEVDSLRADHTEPYGYQRKITPNLHHLAAGGLVMDNFYCSDSPCAPSRAALTTQQFGIVNGAIGNMGPSAQLRSTRGKYNPTDPRYRKEPPFLGGHLYRHGIYTASISCFPDRHQAYWFIGNCREWLKPTLSRGDDEDAKNVHAAAVKWLQSHAGEDDWLLHVQYWDPHIPYIEPTEWFERAAASGPPPSWPDQATIDAHAQVYGPHTALDMWEDDGSWSLPAARAPRPETMPDSIQTRADFEKLINGYDGAVMYWDHYLGELMNTLADLGILDDTAVIVSADHGESFGENGCYADHPMASEPIHHVPMVIKWPGVTDRLESGARRSAQWAYNIDLGPTLCDLLGIPTPEEWHGRSFAAAVRGLPYQGRSHLILSHGAYTYQRAVRTAEYLYIRTTHPGCFRLDWEQLYAMSVDPHMTTNLSNVEASRQVMGQLKVLLDDWWYEYAGTPLAAGDPMQLRPYESPTEAFAAEKYKERLRQTGRGQLADDMEWKLNALRQ